VRSLRPRVTRSNFGAVIVIWRGSRRLYLYDGMAYWRKFKIAVGMPAYPTPLGRFAIATKERNPTWNPPDSDWARGLGPVPPGPGNPLGTRWMGLSAPGYGIHGTPYPETVGTAASHGCIRMYIRESEWLFERVRIGTTVFIIRA
jgi:lipoprotein-anchoring transpeptidase ErfK/SrfK